LEYTYVQSVIGALQTYDMIYDMIGYDKEKKLTEVNACSLHMRAPFILLYVKLD